MKLFSKISVMGLAICFAFGFAGLTKAAVTTVELGTSLNFAVLAGAGITNTGASTISGDIGSSATPTETGFGPGADSVTITSGANHTAVNPNDATTVGAKADLTTAYVDAAGRTPTTTYTPIHDLGGVILTPGVYKDPSSLAITGTLTLDAQGDTGAVWIFQAGSTLVTASSSTVRLVNGAQSCNVFWQVGSSATLGTTTTFVGTIMAQASITDDGGSTVTGRLLARTGAVTLNHTTISATTCSATITAATAEAATYTATQAQVQAAAAAKAAASTDNTPKLPNTGINNGQNNSVRNIMVLAGIVVLLSASFFVSMKKNRA